MSARVEHHVSLVDALLAEQADLGTAISRYSEWHDTHESREPSQARHYRGLIPLSVPKHGQQYAFEVNLDQCTGCKACVAACHSLNGLDDDESWRDVGVLIGDVYVPYQQTITTACHHCLDAACANGCPVLAYEKDALTGIVRHLDDQCIGCSYCILKCPYDVPKYNKKRGIVRKCDMCQQRLAMGEAPACVQSCPSGAIAIRIVNVEEDKFRQSSQGSMLPDVMRSDYTQPTTRYISSKPIPVNAMSAGAESPQAEEAHTPLVFMLVLTQLATGVLLFSQRHVALCWIGFATASLGILASVFHLGQPLKAWRCFLGWRKSWLSREILAFGLFAPAAFASALEFIPAWPAALAGLLSVLCSVMVYVDTRRPFWEMAQTAPKFIGTAMVLGTAVAANWDATLRTEACVFAAAKLAWEALYLSLDEPRHARSHGLLFGPLHGWHVARFAIGLCGAVFMLHSAWLGLALLLIGEYLERTLFFRAAAAWRMPRSA
jgi:Fe-S-cluster-containing dehydrogenase component/DMSO reductase anchor subunit